MHQRTKIAVAVAMALNSVSAFAQTSAVPQADAPQRVEVTGSRIRQVDLETAQPIQVMTQQQIQATGLVTVGDILNQMSSAGTPAFSKGSTLTSNREQGGQFIDMRNLGAQRLLVLVNGKRWTQSVDGFTDMSTVPTSMIDHIEILKDGASAIYGSDAIAGVVNIILKKTMVGGSASIYKGINEKGDGKTEDYAVSYGAGDEKASLMFGLTHSRQMPVWANKREITSYSYGPDNFDAGFGTGPWGRITPLTANGSSNTVAANGGFNKYLNHTGTYDGGGVGANARDPNNYHTYTGADADTFNSSQQMMFQSPTRLTSIFTKGSIELPMDMRFTTTAMYAERDSSRQVAGYPLNSKSQPNFPVYIDKDSYYNPYGNQVAGAGLGQDLFFARRTIEVPRVTDNRNQTLHVDATLEGNFSLRGLPWNWSAGYNHSEVSGTTDSTGNLNLLNLKKALGPSFMNANGVVQCGTAASPIPFNQCTPVNILGGPSASNAAGLAYIMSNGQGTYGSTVNSATADVSGELFTLPAGPLGVAGGLEHRESRGFDRPGQFEQSGYSTDLAANTTEGRYTVKEAYLEANIPVLKDKPFAQLLSFDLATRYSDYSNFGSTTNSKVSFMWKPHKDLLTRGTWAEGFRAPAVGDSFGGGGQSFDSYLDACDSRYGEAATNPVVKARCTAAGVPTNYRQLNQSGNPVSAATQSTVPFQSGVGNADLQPETAKTKTLGFVYSPSFVPGLTGAIDWFKVNIKNQISGVTATDTVNNCFIDAVQSYCDKIQRDSTGAIIGLSHGTVNLGELSTEGYDIAIGYKIPRTPYGLFAVRTESTFVKSFKSKSAANADWQEYAGEYGYNRFKSNVSLDWSLGNWSSTLTLRYQSAVKDQCWDNEDLTTCTNPTAEGPSWGTGYDRKGSITYTDLSVGYDTSWKGQIRAGVNNLFARGPRIMYAASSNLNGTSSSSSVDPDAPLDRFFYVRYNQAF